MKDIRKKTQERYEWQNDLIYPECFIFALESYSLAAASELGRFGIMVNIVSPGPIQTGYIAPELEQQLNKEIPLGRIGQPEDVADIIVFLASEQARWLTGQLLFVGGGHRMI